MKVLMLNGSPRNSGNTAYCLNYLKGLLQSASMETEIIQIGNRAVQGCQSCFQCGKNGKCIIDDEVNITAEKFREADCLILASPVYFASPNGAMLSFLDRLFFSSGFDKRTKVGAVIVTTRRSGAAASYDVLNKYFMSSSMPICTAQSYNTVHGFIKTESMQDEEGLQALDVLAENLIFLLRSVAYGKEHFPLPKRKKRIHTNLIRK